MRKYLGVIWICIVLVLAGCSAGSDHSEKAAPAEKTEQTQESEEKKTASEDVSGESQGTSQPDAGAAETAGEKEAEENASEETALEETASEETALEETASEETALEETNSEETVSDAEAAEETAQAEGQEPAAEETQGQEGQEEQEPEEQYMPDGFTPYGYYVLDYDSGYEVKTRYSEAGLTYYMEGEEFMFKLNKDLPDMKREVAHILFNTVAPMDPSDTGGEEFPFEESYVLYISLDDGSYYEVYKSGLDMEGRIFVRDVFESFREKWEGAF